jgi:plasmid stabilization system protein ParE
MPAGRARAVEFSRRAARDYVRALLYPARESLPAAHLFQDRIKRAQDLLAERPLIGRPSNRPGIRELVLGRVPYTAVYRVESRRVVIIRLLHQARMPRGRGS